MEEPNLTAWKKSSYSDSTGGNCVQVARHAGGFAVRDSKNPQGGHLYFTPDEWNAFLNGVKAGEFDHVP
ncbi:DUF397 domain-containing protein [Acrocarpospora corrugata]|uniref:DUF397 domain-containing protein n=1 Tax=Acrocarpospora corrugata TaxID=35763 RepID=A0A5M3VZY5_9ACTN|nr:DUF397 domain-containing protein [Acrocarpospora corrugata]GES02014.1 DUF397 domain-containing protein [Acrocarpospora corrugata]